MFTRYLISLKRDIRLRAFSLIELLISLIVISCITAAFTPLITKKFSSGILGGGGSVSDISADCEKFGPNCNLCTSNFCLSCTGLTCNSDEYKDNKSCTCKKCVDKFGADCTKCNEDKCLICPSGQYLNRDDNCVSCTTKFSDCATCNEDQCLSCKDGKILTDPTSTTPCSNFTCSSPDFMQIGNLCITKKNMGDSTALTIPSGVNIVNTGSICNPSSGNFCCWQGSTASDCDSINGNYSGCNRTVCDHNAANYICTNFNAGGLTWKLPSTDELAGWEKYSIGLGTYGLQLCDDYSGYSSARCNGASRCNGAYTNWCGPRQVWSSLAYSSTNYYHYYLLGGVWSQDNFRYSYAISTRCVTTMSQSCAQRISEGCLSCDGNTCISCDAGYKLNNGRCVIDCSSKFGSNCTSCTSSKCSACASGYKLVDGVCKTDCATKFGTNCTECTLNKCTECADKYKLSSDPSANPACESEFTCSGENFIQIGNLCVTTKNMGDSANLSIPSGVNVVQTGQYCDSTNSKCCWQGKTARLCDDENGGGYSGCNRTVCNWEAGDYICSNFYEGGRAWRLPTKYEMSDWVNYSVEKGNEGLQLCDQMNGYLSARCSDSAGLSGCQGGPQSGYCFPYYIWSSSPIGNDISIFYYLYAGNWTQGQYQHNYPMSIRCVTDL